MDYNKMKTSTLFLKYVIPQMIGLVFNSIYFIVDGMFIGRRLGTNALAAAGVAVPVVEIMIALSMLIAVGTGVIISSANGRGDTKMARNAFNLSMVFTVGFSVAIAVLGVLFAQPMARFLGAGDVILGDTVTYLQYFLAFSPFLVLSFTLSTYARNDGKPGLAMWSLLIGSISNIVLDYVFMYPLDMGIAGAALATGLGPVFSVLILLPHFLRKKGNLYFQKTRFSLKLLLKIGINGLPAFVAEFSIGFVTLLYNLAIVKNGLGDDGLAAYVVIGYAALICLTAFLGAAQGVQPAISYFTGAEEWGRIRRLFKATVWFNVLMGILFYVLLFFGGRLFFSIFIDTNAELLAFTSGVGQIYFSNLPLAAFNILLISFLQSMGNTGSAMAVSLSRSTLPVFVFLTVLPALLGQTGLWLAVAFAEAVTLLLGVLLWKRAWAAKRKSVTARADAG
ncbi:polysaccharide biosynthesis C-terminal domain-containing protein [Christensenellaceae bacterium OttesenSCG-928-K19]|nr:polysaccharide biosynthesis C-terminal domain-containing protein [Christensenellaceae bacterium OttesenSCG-928-K19]